RFVGVEQSPPETGVALATRILVVSHGDEISRITASTHILTAPCGKKHALCATPPGKTAKL
ncbi:TPA: hypothetical protein ACXEV6_004517, partial [Serratia marcescens]